MTRVRNTANRCQRSARIPIRIPEIGPRRAPGISLKTRPTATRGFGYWLKAGIAFSPTAADRRRPDPARRLVHLLCALADAQQTHPWLQAGKKWQRRPRPSGYREAEDRGAGGEAARPGRKIPAPHRAGPEARRRAQTPGRRAQADPTRRGSHPPFPHRRPLWITGIPAGRRRYELEVQRRRHLAAKSDSAPNAIAVG